MARKVWWGVSLVAGLMAAAVAVFLMQAPPPSTALAPSSVRAPPAERAKSVEPAPAQPDQSTDPAQAARPKVAYDQYRTEMRRQREAREAAQAVQSNERCIAGQLFRKVGSEWVQAGHC